MSNPTDTEISIAELHLTNALTNPNFSSMFDDVQKLEALRLYAAIISNIINQRRSTDIKKAQESLKNKNRDIHSALTSISSNLQRGKYNGDETERIQSLFKDIIEKLLPLLS